MSKADKGQGRVCDPGEHTVRVEAYGDLLHINRAFEQVLDGLKSRGTQPLCSFAFP